jgi:threonine/homoserine/homoserine lactone efflux protein
MSSFLTLLTQIVPLALGAAVSPTALMGIILLLSISKRPKLQGFGYYFGAIILILIVVILGILLSTGVTSASPTPDPTLAAIDLLLGIILLFFGIKRIFKPQKSPKKRFQSIGKESSNLILFIEGLSFGFGMFLVNFSTTIIILEAGKEIGLSLVDPIGKLIIVIILTFITLIVCEVPLGIYLLFPEKANNILSKVNKWMQRNGHYLMGVVLIVIGVYLVWIGLYKLGII